MKAAISHSGRIKYPRHENGYLVLGSALDIIGGLIFGGIAANSLVYGFFGLTAPNAAFSLLSGIFWMSILESLGTKFGFNGRNSGSNPGKGTSLGSIWKKKERVGGVIPILAVHRV